VHGFLALLSIGLAGCLAADPPDGALGCDNDGRCPSGYACAANLTCWRQGRQPDLADLTDGGAISPACAPDVFFCDDFENGFQPPRWTGPLTPSGDTQSSVLVDGALPHEGGQSLHITLAPGTQNPIVYETAFTPIQSGIFGARAFVYFEDTPADNQLMLAAGFGSTFYTNNLYLMGGIYGSGGKVEWGIYAPNHVTGQSTMVIPGGQWLCVEFVYDFDTELVQLYVDNQLAVSFTQSQAPPLAFGFFGLGSVLTTVTNNQIFVDDVALAARRVGDCP
jgi:hypothetical protein